MKENIHTTELIKIREKVKSLRKLINKEIDLAEEYLCNNRDDIKALFPKIGKIYKFERENFEAVYGKLDDAYDISRNWRMPGSRKLEQCVYLRVKKNRLLAKRAHSDWNIIPLVGCDLLDEGFSEIEGGYTHDADLIPIIAFSDNPINLKARKKGANVKFVYLMHMEDSSLYKIGVSSNPEGSRLSQVQTGNPFTVSLHSKYLVPNCTDHEYYLHNKYDGYRRKGEWFSLTPEMVKEIKEYLKEYIV